MIITNGAWRGPHAEEARDHEDAPEDGARACSEACRTLGFRNFDPENGPRPWSFECSKAIPILRKTSHDAGIRDPHFEDMHFEFESPWRTLV